MPAAALVNHQTAFILADQIRVAKVFDWHASLCVLNSRKRDGSDPNFTQWANELTHAGRTINQNYWLCHGPLACDKSRMSPSWAG